MPSGTVTPAGSSGGSLPVARQALYQQAVMGAGQPALAVNATPRHDANGVTVQVNGVTTAQIDVLTTCLLSVTFNGRMFAAGTTGAYVILYLTQSGSETARFTSEAGADGGEIDTSVSLANVPMAAGDSIKVEMNPVGANNTGNACYVFVSTLSAT